MTKPILICRLAWCAVALWILLGSLGDGPVFASARAADLQLQDLFADRERATTKSGSAEGSNRSATLEPREPRHGGKVGGRSLWMSWTAPSTGIATFETSRSTFDTLLSAYLLEDGDPTKPAMERLKEVARTDDDPGSLAAVIQFGVTAGTTYEIAVDGYRGANGDARLRWDLLESDRPPPTILQVPPDRSLRLGDSVTLTVDFLAGEEVNLEWLFNGDDTLNVETASLTIPNFQLANVGRYQLRITADRVRLVSAPIELQINSEGEITALARDKVFDALDSPLIGLGTEQALRSEFLSPRQTSRRALSAIGVTRGYNGVQIFNTQYATREPGEPAHCGVIGSASYWLAYQAPANGTLVLDTDGSSFDTVLAVYTYEAPLAGYEGLIPVTCDDNSGANGLTSRVELQTVQGRTYLVVVDGSGGARGLAHLNYRLSAKTSETLPTVTLESVPKAAAEGETVRFTASAVGSPPLEFQWQKNGVALPGATDPVLTLPSVQPADAGLYALRVSNLAGSVTSPETLLEIGARMHILPRPATGQMRLSLRGFVGMRYVLESRALHTGAPWELESTGIATEPELLIGVPVRPAPGRLYRFSQSSPSAAATTPSPRAP